MLKLIKLELKRNNIYPYVTASIVITIVMLGLIYLFAYAPKIDPNDADMKLFAGYNNIVSLFCLLNMATFCVLSSVMFSRFIIDEYSGKRTILLFSYPISRSRILFSKLYIVILFTIFAMIVCNTIVFTIFGITESFIPIVGEVFSASIIVKIIKTTIIMALSSASIGIVALGIGFIKRSVPATIVSAFILSSLMCNIAVNTISNDIVMVVFMTVMILAGSAVLIILVRQINLMEVE